MARPRKTSLFSAPVALVALAGASVPSGAWAAPDERPLLRAAWAGIERGILAPAEAAKIEAAVLRALDARESLHLLDAAGHALGEAALQRETERCARLVAEGVDHLLRQRYPQALDRLDQALRLFEAQLAPLPDHDLLHDALLARAEAQAAAGEREGARTTLRRLAALSPKRTPTPETHRPDLLKLWRAAKKSVGRPSRLELETDEPGAIIRVDGKLLGPAPAAVPRLAPGGHYVVAEWPGFIVADSVQLGAGTKKTVELSKNGLSWAARTALIESIARRPGVAPISEDVAKVATIATADAVIVAVVRTSGEVPMLYLARHDASGGPEAIAGVALPADRTPEAIDAIVPILVTAVTGARSGAFLLDAARKPQPATGVVEACYGGVPGSPVRDPALAPSAAPTLVPADESGIVRPPPPPPEPAPITEQWWFWALAGAAAIGAGAAGFLLLRPDASTTTFDVVLPAR